MATTHYSHAKPEFLTTTYSFLPQPISAMKELTYKRQGIPAELELTFVPQYIPGMQKMTFGPQQCISALPYYFSLYLLSGFLV
jgi:hypothetical protein